MTRAVGTDNVVPGSIDHDLRRSEYRESQLWVITLALLILFGTVIVVNHVIRSLDRDLGLARVVWAHLPTLGGLFFLVLLFCLYTTHIRRANRAMKDLLVEMHTLAASSAEVSAFLDSVSRKIATICSATTCRVTLLSPDRCYLTITSAYVERELGPKLIGRRYRLRDSTVASQVVATLRPVVLHRSEMAQLPDADRELLAGSSRNVAVLLVVPMVTDDRILGIIALGTTARVRRRFSTSRTVLAQALAARAATAIDQANLKQQAIHDPLTKLYNRRHFSARLQEEIARAARNQEIIAILMCDLDRFKAINDTRGHQFGDEVLKTVAKGILESTRGSDVVFRWGGDEILVVLPKSSRDGGAIAAERIRRAVSDVAERARFDLDVSVGIALYPEHGSSEDELIRVADRAMYTAKKNGTGFHVGDSGALGPHSVGVVFQPVVDLSSRAVVGHEALARDPEAKLSVAELFDKYRALGRLCELKQVIFKSQLATAQDVGVRTVFLNVDFRLLSAVAPIPKPADVRVVLELSEQAALPTLDDHLTVARGWRRMGYEFAIDNFGAGFISLPFLSLLAPEYVKVDRATMSQALSSEKFKRFLRWLLCAVGTYATAGIIAEGIDSDEKLVLAKELGIPLAQGMLLGKPHELTSNPAEQALQEAASRKLGCETSQEPET